MVKASKVNPRPSKPQANAEQQKLDRFVTAKNSAQKHSNDVPQNIRGLVQVEPARKRDGDHQDIGINSDSQEQARREFIDDAAERIEEKEAHNTLRYEDQDKIALNLQTVDQQIQRKCGNSTMNTYAKYPYAETSKDQRKALQARLLAIADKYILQVKQSMRCSSLQATQAVHTIMENAKNQYLAGPSSSQEEQVDSNTPPPQPKTKKISKVKSIDIPTLKQAGRLRKGANMEVEQSRSVSQYKIDPPNHFLSMSYNQLLALSANNSNLYRDNLYMEALVAKTPADPTFQQSSSVIQPPVIKSNVGINCQSCKARCLQAWGDKCADQNIRLQVSGFGAAKNKRYAVIPCKSCLLALFTILTQTCNQLANHVFNTTNLAVGDKMLMLHSLSTVPSIFTDKYFNCQDYIGKVKKPQLFCYEVIGTSMLGLRIQIYHGNPYSFSASKIIKQHLVWDDSSNKWILPGGLKDTFNGMQLPDILMECQEIVQSTATSILEIFVKKLGQRFVPIVPQVQKPVQMTYTFDRRNL